jgi:hypothetical protein
MNRTLKHVLLTDIISFALIISILGCSLAWEAPKNPKIEEKEMIPIVARVLDEQLEIVAPVLEENGELNNNSRFLIQNSSGKEIVQRMLLEKQGSDYLRFSHAVTTGTDTNQILKEAATLLNDEDYSELAAQMVEAENSLRDFKEEQVRALPPSQRAPFLRDLQKLVTKTLVLMVAGIVYACIPTVVFWGKIAAAAAISVAAGIVATTVMSIYRYYKYSDDSLSQSFQDWIIDVTTDPSAAYAVAASMTTVGKTMTNGPVVTGLIIVVFAIYQVMDLVKPLLKKYNFNA